MVLRFGNDPDIWSMTHKLSICSVLYLIRKKSCCVIFLTDQTYSEHVCVCVYVYRPWHVVPQICWPSVFCDHLGSLGLMWPWEVLRDLEFPSVMVGHMQLFSQSKITLSA